MNERVQAWAAQLGLEIVIPFTSALRTLQVRCPLCAVVYTDYAKTLVEWERCPTCPNYTSVFEARGWVVEHGYTLDSMAFVYGLDVEGTAVVVDATPSDARRDAVEKHGFRYVPWTQSSTADDVLSLCTGSAPVPLAAPRPVAKATTRPRYGWRWVGKRQPLAPEPAEQAMVEWLRRERNTHPEMTVNALCKQLDGHPEFPKRGAKHWHPTALQRIMEYYNIPVRPNYYLQ